MHTDDHIESQGRAQSSVPKPWCQLKWENVFEATNENIKLIFSNHASSKTHLLSSVHKLIMFQIHQHMATYYFWQSIKVYSGPAQRHCVCPHFGKNDSCICNLLIWRKLWPSAALCSPLVHPHMSHIKSRNHMSILSWSRLHCTVVCGNVMQWMWCCKQPVRSAVLGKILCLTEIDLRYLSRQQRSHFPWDAQNRVHGSRKEAGNHVATKTKWPTSDNRVKWFDKLCKLH